MKKSIVIIITLLVGCSSTRELKKQDVLYGRWCLNKQQLNYPEIDFSTDGIAILKSRGDTLYSYRYFFKGQTLSFVVSRDQIVPNRILKLTSDSLIFETLLELKEKQVYSRCK